MGIAPLHPSYSALFSVLSYIVVVGLDPASHGAAKLPLSFRRRNSAWTAGSSPVVTKTGLFDMVAGNFARECAARTTALIRPFAQGRMQG
jgi:acetyl-CoA acetyltransferase